MQIEKQKILKRSLYWSYFLNQIGTNVVVFGYVYGLVTLQCHFDSLIKVLEFVVD